MNQHESNILVNPHVSVDCVLFGYDGDDLKVLLVQQIDQQNMQKGSMKLPGSLIYEDEDLDEAAGRVLYELTGVGDIDLLQFQAFGSKDRTRKPKDTLWLERFHKLNTAVDRIVTVAYMAVVKIDKRLKELSSQYNACWLSLDEIGELAFDHNQIISCAIKQLQSYVENNPVILYGLLPHKFTIQQIRHLHELIFNKVYDPRNFHKKLSQMNYIIPLNDYQKGVHHRAARFYKFDRKVYNKEIHKIF
jgi:hypothetical protein